MNDYRAMADRWISWPGMPEELSDQLRGMNDEEISDCFYRSLAFGTGGLRGVLGPGENRMNFYTVSKATRGLGKYILSASDTPSCAISYDSRIHSKDFAELAAATLADMGVRVYLYDALKPTPMLSYAVRYLGCTAGVMITASHNPAKFNGYKVYGPDGCQITIDAADRILKEINAQETLIPALASFEDALKAGKVTYIQSDLIESYYACIDALRIERPTQPLHVVYSPLNGTGNVPVREMLRRCGNIEVSVVKEQELPDGHFPTAPYPNPEIREAMQLAIEQCIREKADFCFATDPDCDRFGAGVLKGEDVVLISGNDMGVLLLDYICRHKLPLNRADGKRPVAVKTIVTTEMARAICEKYDVELRDVLTGFKFIGEQIGNLEKDNEKERFIFGFEESYGYLSFTDVRDKDAVNASVLVCEMAASLKAEGKTLLDRLQELREEFGFYGQRLLTFEYEGESGAEVMNGIMSVLRSPLDTFEADLLKTASRIDYLNDETGLPKSDVLSFSLRDGRKIIVRPSGTEPKLKAYLFASAKDEQGLPAMLDELEAVVITYCKK